MIFYLLIYFASSNLNINKVLVGNWNISKFQLTADGIEIPDNNNSLILNLGFNQDENYIYGNISETTKIENKNESIFLRLYPLPKSTFSVKINQSNEIQEYTELMLLKINMGLDDMMTATGKIANCTYSLNISPPSSAELIIFNQNTKKVNIYRFHKKIYHRKLNFYHIAPFITTFIYTTIKFLLG